MKVVVSLTLSKEDLAAIAHVTNAGKSGQAYFDVPTEREIQRLVRAWVDDAVEHLYVSSGRGRAIFLEQWKHEKNNRTRPKRRIQGE